MQSSQHERRSKKGLLTGFPLRHLRHLRWLAKNYIAPPPSQWADSIKSSILSFANRPDCHLQSLAF